MKQYEFESGVTIRGTVKREWSQNEIKNEPMLFNCSLGSAYKLSGPITKDIIATLPDDWHDTPVVVDSRVHMLKKGYYPCIPGFHHDDVPRSRSDGQPNYHRPEYRSKHLMVLVNGDICPTEFALGVAEFDEVPVGQTIYKEWHKTVVKHLDDGILQKFHAPDRTLIQFDDRTWHQGTQAVADGWRFFIRFSQNTDRTFSPTNEVRRQVQVYLEAPMEGW